MQRKVTLHRHTSRKYRRVPFHEDYLPGLQAPAYLQQTSSVHFRSSLITSPNYHDASYIPLPPQASSTQNHDLSIHNKRLISNHSRSDSTAWTYVSRAITCCFPNFLFYGLFPKHFKDRITIQAWREKVALCLIILVLSLLVGFSTVALSRILCANDGKASESRDFSGLPRNACPQRLQSLPLSNQTNVYDWDRLPSDTVFVVNGIVLNADSYLKDFSKLINDALDETLRKAVNNARNGNKDATVTFLKNPVAQKFVPCLQAKYRVGFIDKKTPSCFFYDILLVLSTIIVVGIMAAKFTMAILYYHTVGAKLTKPPTSIANAALKKTSLDKNLSRLSKLDPHLNYFDEQLPSQQLAATDNLSYLPYTVLLVTCYSESEKSLRLTLDSLANTTYPASRKLLFIVADGVVTGSENSMPTTDIVKSLIEPASDWIPKQCMYDAIGGPNRAEIISGYYRCGEHAVPAVAVLKCGLPNEESKPGNRGKRDSQVLLMNFFARCLVYDRMSPMDYVLFDAVQMLMGVPADKFEACLMVDADTEVDRFALELLVNGLLNDQDIMGICGETRIMNKRDSFVTMIQVFEYFISHHFGKSFESMFGGVTCLPGCFSMWRLKGRPKNWIRHDQNHDTWTPLLTSQDVIDEYCQSEVNTLHEKNLLLLGEDRFLTTLMLRQFPSRKVMFAPEALCHTYVPDTFKVLFSQRRRWINSTIHNLLELVQVNNLCGTFCFSMQFVVFTELLGTVLLPISTVLLILLIVTTGMNLSTASNLPPYTTLVPLFLLIISFLLPAILVMVTTRKIVYIGWMIIYLFAIPIWQFFLPLYAFWHFDDISWGATRKLSGGDSSGHGESEKDGQMEHVVTMRFWHEWEKQKRMKQRRERMAQQIQRHIVNNQ